MISSLMMLVAIGFRRRWHVLRLHPARKAGPGPSRLCAMNEKAGVFCDAPTGFRAWPAGERLLNGLIT
jgi:hypothetical protein